MPQSNKKAKLSQKENGTSVAETSGFPYCNPYFECDIIKDKVVKSMQIPILIEPDYERSAWAQIVLNGIRTEALKLKYKVCMLDSSSYTTLDWDSFFENGERMVLVLAPSIFWAPRMLSYFEEQNISVILIVFDPSETAPVRGLVRMDYVHAMEQLLRYLEGCGRKRIALYGVNPTYFVDDLKTSCFKSWNSAHETSIYPAYASLSECFDSFLPHARSYDAVICSNATVALSLVQHLGQHSIRVPEDLYVASFGYNKLSESISPSITCVTLNYEEVGRQSVRLYSWLIRQKPCSNVSVRVRSHLMIRESTALQSPAASEAKSSLATSPSVPKDVYLYCDPEAKRLQAIESILNICDETDEQLIQGLLNQQTNAQLEENLFLSSYALRYRLKRLMSLANCEHKHELLEFLTFYRKTVSKEQKNICS